MTSTDRVASTVFAVLVVACFAAFLVTQRLKHTPTAVQRFEMTLSFAPLSRGPDRLEAISFKLAHADQVTVTIIDSSGAEVATLLRDHPVASYKQLSLRWNGRRGPSDGYRVIEAADGAKSLLANNAGAVAGEAEYRVRVSLRRQHVTVLSPRSFTLDRG